MPKTLIQPDLQIYPSQVVQNFFLAFHYHLEYAYKV
jgi:hypothetical protein